VEVEKHLQELEPEDLFQTAAPILLDLLVRDPAAWWGGAAEFGSDLLDELLEHGNLRQPYRDIAVTFQSNDWRRPVLVVSRLAAVQLFIRSTADGR
jgi:hypothetical protein